ncbi:MAG: hypothetical protein ACREX9_24100, partial [Gammaproteobacteria bacterium]
LHTVHAPTATELQALLNRIIFNAHKWGKLNATRATDIENWRRPEVLAPLFAQCGVRALLSSRSAR